ncbi:MAG: hypothetical protein IRY99_25325 [Isosphaeraceae bacterium]|nr:hypothetical protein [Isosphaeraceae bacterium]
MRIDLIDGSSAVLASAIAGVDGTFQIRTPTPLAEGVYQLRYRLSDAAGNVSFGPSADFRIKTTSPSQVPTLTLLPADRIGGWWSTVTNTLRPRLTGTTDPGNIVELIGPSGDIVAQTTAGDDGSYLIPYPTDLPVGPQVVMVQVHDIAGNPGPSSPPLRLYVTKGRAKAAVLSAQWQGRFGPFRARPTSRSAPSSPGQSLISPQAPRPAHSGSHPKPRPAPHRPAPHRPALHRHAPPRHSR